MIIKIQIEISYAGSLSYVQEISGRRWISVLVRYLYTYVPSRHLKESLSFPGKPPNDFLRKECRCLLREEILLHNSDFVNISRIILTFVLAFVAEVFTPFDYRCFETPYSAVMLFMMRLFLR